MSTLSPAPAAAPLSVRLASGAFRSSVPEPPPGQSPDPARDVVESASALVGSVVGTGAHLAPAVVAGAMQGVTGDLDAQSIGLMAGTAIVIESAVAGLVLGAMAAGPVGAVTGGGAGVMVGLAMDVLESKGPGSERIGAAIKEAVDRAISDNEPSRSRLKDGTRNLVEGAIIGGLAGARVAFGVSREGGAGLGAGVVDGARKVIPVLVGRYDPDPSQVAPGSATVPSTPPGGAASPPSSTEDASASPSPGPLKAVLGTLASAAREVLTRVVGTATGLASAAVNCLYGALQGASAPRPFSADDFSESHGVVLTSEAMITGAVAAVGILAAMPGVGAVEAVLLGSLVGVLAGGIVGSLLASIDETLGTDVQVSDLVNDCLEKALAGASTSLDDQVGTVRDAVEGAVVGAAAGVRAGFVTGFEVGRGAVDGAWDGLAGGARPATCP